MPVLPLNSNNVANLPYHANGEGHQCIYWDAAFSGFGLRVYPSGRRAYVCSYRLQQRKRLVVVGPGSLLTLEQAKQRALSMLGQVAVGEDPQAGVRRRRAVKTVAELCAAFVEQHAKIKRVGWRSDESTLRRRLLPNHRHRIAAKLTTADLEVIHAEIGQQHSYAANEFLGLVSTMFNWATLVGILPKDHANPTRGIVRFTERKRRRYLTTAEMPGFIAALEAEDNEYARHGLWLLLLLGLRHKELLRAKWADIDWTRGTLFVGLTKNGEPLLAPLSDAALARLKLIPRIPNNPYIICGLRSGRSLTGLGGPLRRVLKRAGLVNVRVHDLRRTVGSWLAQAGVSLHLIGNVLNHRDLGTTLGYAYFETQHRQEALTRYGERVLACAEEPLRVGMEPRLLTAEIVLRPPESPLRVRHYFKREALYELVWTAPVSEVSSRLGVSDVGFAKLCRRARVPVPARGYWARLDAGQLPSRPPLPRASGDLPLLLRIRGNKRCGLPCEPASAHSHTNPT
jgi:integrase